MKLVIATLSIVILVLASSFVHPSMALNDTIKPNTNLDCGSLCGARCSKAGHEGCMKFCQICCQKCNCVPSGTYGNKHQCPCYRDMRNSKGKPKCP
ncbi:peamaclein-like [Chenopodium quinoa]|uniref:Snakin-1 n=1 Tax=Chenopodium quinoa TaxID=63459 RepID=A0A803KY49_CHEQI|nr:peamaclein-like [Chenopodium quinoa]